MADEDKMSRVKESLRTMLTKLRPDDIISIVAFDSSAQVLYPASRIGSGEGVGRAIDCLVPDGPPIFMRGSCLATRRPKRIFVPAQLTV
jgi:hypothetical protein